MTFFIGFVSHSSRSNFFLLLLLDLEPMEEEDPSAKYRHLLFHGPSAISSKLGSSGGGGGGGEHIYTILNTFQEHIVVEKEHSKEGSSH